MTTSLYRHFDKSGALLYIGIALSPLARLSAHRTSSHWAKGIARVEIVNYPNRKTALIAESAAIIAECPLHNLRHLKKYQKRVHPKYQAKILSEFTQYWRDIERSRALVG